MQSKTALQHTPLNSIQHGIQFNAQYLPLEQITRSNLTTAETAFYLNRRPQTLRGWGLENGPIRPIRINGRLAWPVAALKTLLGVSA